MTSKKTAAAFAPMAESTIFSTGLTYGAASSDAGGALALLAKALEAEYAPRLSPLNSDDAKRKLSSAAYIDAGEGVVIAYMRRRGLSAYSHASDTPEGVAMRLRVREWLGQSVARVKDWNKSLSETERDAFKSAATPIGRALKAAGLPNPNPRAPRASKEGEKGADPKAHENKAEKVVAKPENIKAPAGADGQWLYEMAAFIVQRSKGGVAKQGEHERALWAAIDGAVAAYSKALIEAK